MADARPRPGPGPGPGPGARRFAVAIAAALVAATAPAGRSWAEPQVDATVRPGDDFYRYANGPWLAATPLPPGRASYDTTAMLRDATAVRVRSLMEDAARAPSSPAAQRIGDYYAAWLDVGAIEARGAASMAAELAAIAAIGDRSALSAYLGRTLALDDGTNTHTEGLFGVWIHQDFHDPAHYVPHLVQGGLGLADRDDDLGGGADRAAHRELYRAHVAALLRLAGLDQADLRAGRVLALETAIARTHASDADTADVFKTDNPWRPADFAAKAPGMDWAAWFSAAGLGGAKEVVVWQPSAVVGAAALVRDQPLDAWRDYLAARLIAHHIPVLPRAFGAEDAAFQDRLAGRTPGPPDLAPESRARQAQAATTSALGYDVARLYVARWFPPEAKAAAQAMAGNLRAAFQARLPAVAWMSSGVRETALAKLASLNLGLGYPDSWPESSGLIVRRDDAYGNLDRSEAFAYQREIAKIGRPVDPGEWAAQLWPHAVGGVIWFSPNTEQFSAGLLQPPFFDPMGDAAANYGSAGAGMAHEISHTFDDLGSLYDAQGRLVRWWTPDDLERYRDALAPLAAQLAKDCPVAGLCVKGDQVMGETSADLVGLQMAYDAYHLSLAGKPDVIKDGLTGDQRFFLAFAQRWRRQQTDAALRQQIATDPHAPPASRADIVRNLAAWQRAFDVKPGDRLWLAPDAQVRTW